MHHIPLPQTPHYTPFQRPVETPAHYRYPVNRLRFARLFLYATPNPLSVGAPDLSLDATAAVHKARSNCRIQPLTTTQVTAGSYHEQHSVLVNLETSANPLEDSIAR